jgi:hypothetical protein
LGLVKSGVFWKGLSSGKCLWKGVKKASCPVSQEALAGEVISQKSNVSDMATGNVAFSTSNFMISI